MFKVMITAASSNSGKTAVTCGLLALLKRRGLEPAAFKCGPDYIDPMFHRSVLGIRSSNLDVFLAGEKGVQRAFARGCEGCGAAICEGVMGFYDGMSTDSARASAWHVAQLCDLPAVLVIRPKGAALTLAAVIRGMAEFTPPGAEGNGMKRELSPVTDGNDPPAVSTGCNHICGVVFNDCSEMYYRTYGPVIERASGIPVLGYLPHMEEAVFESRHLGLMTAEEIRDLGARIDRIAERMEETIDLKRLFAVMGKSAHEGADEGSDTGQANRVVVRSIDDDTGITGSFENDDNSAGIDVSDHNELPHPVRIAVAKDAAFNFIYAESIAALEEAGAEICYFSPLADEQLPADIHGLYLPGGYPELYGKQLSENTTMRESIRMALTGSVSAASSEPKASATETAVASGLPTIAECGGFLYLGETLADTNGDIWPMAGVLPGHSAGTGRLVRFGYGYIGCDRDSMLFRSDEQVPVHEFHYWDTTEQGSDLTLTKNSNGKQRTFGYATNTLYAGFPHLYLAGACDIMTVSDEKKPGGEDGKNSSGDGVVIKRYETLASRFVEAARRHADHYEKKSATDEAAAQTIQTDLTGTYDPTEPGA